MEWVDGLQLDSYVEQLVDRRTTSALAALANDWRNLIIGLQQNQIAHGDLQHENILVNSGYIRIVDYDGVFVPSLAGMSGLEIGHSHYQHPRRTLADFNLNSDNFSAIVIYLSLKALSSDPSLWSKFHTDKHLISRAGDFHSPQASRAISSLKQSMDAEVRALTTALESSCSAPLSSVPGLDSITKAFYPGMGGWRESWVGMEPSLLPKIPPSIPCSRCGFRIEDLSLFICPRCAVQNVRVHLWGDITCPNCHTKSPAKSPHTPSKPVHCPKCGRQVIQ